jgi:ferredoxin
MNSITTDVAVMGSGLAGITAAVTLAEKGAKVALFEKRPFQGGGVSNTPMMTLTVKNDRKFQDKAFEVHMNYTIQSADPRVVRSWINNTYRIPGFIKSLGIDFMAVVETPYEKLGQERGYCGGFPNGYNIDFCIRCGLCEDLYPELFKLNYDGDKIDILYDEIPAGLQEKAKNAMADCAVTAIFQS